MFQSRALIALCLLGSLSLVSGCAGRDRYGALPGPDARVLVREWTRVTEKSVEAGARGIDFSNAATYDTTLLFGSRSAGLASIYPISNTVRWVLPIEKGVRSPISVAGDSAYFAGGDGFLYAVAAETGKVRWRYRTRVANASRPVVSQGRLFLNSGEDTIVALDAGTGKWLWQYKRRSNPTSTILGASAPLVDGTDVLAGTSDGYLVCLSIEDGRLLWERQLHATGKFTDVDATPVRDGDQLLIPSYDGALYALNRKDGATVWRFDAGGSQTVSVEGDRVYLPSSNGSIYALNKLTSKEIWRFELDSGAPTSLVVTPKFLIFGSSHQYLYVLEKDSGKLVYRWDAGLDAGFFGSPFFDAATQRLYALSSGGNLYAFKLRKPRAREMKFAVGDPYVFSTRVGR